MALPRASLPRLPSAMVSMLTSLPLWLKFTRPSTPDQPWLRLLFTTESSVLAPFRSDPSRSSPDTSMLLLASPSSSLQHSPTLLAHPRPLRPPSQLLHQPYQVILQTKFLGAMNKVLKSYRRKVLKVLLPLVLTQLFCSLSRQAGRTSLFLGEGLFLMPKTFNSTFTILQQSQCHQ